MGNDKNKEWNINPKTTSSSFFFHSSSTRATKTFLRPSTGRLSSIVTHTCFDSMVSSSPALSESVNFVHHSLCLPACVEPGDLTHLSVEHTHIYTLLAATMCPYLLFLVHLKCLFITLIPSNELSHISKAEIPLLLDKNLQHLET